MSGSGISMGSSVQEKPVIVIITSVIDKRKYFGCLAMVRIYITFYRNHPMTLPPNFVFSSLKTILFNPLLKTCLKENIYIFRPNSFSS